MGFHNGAYAKVWKIEVFQKYSKVNLSTSIKGKDTGKYETDFSAFVSFVGDAHKSILSLNEGDRIKLVSTDVTTNIKKQTGEKFTNYTLFEWEPAKPYTSSEKSAIDINANTIDSSEEDDESNSDELPF